MGKQKYLKRMQHVLSDMPQDLLLIVNGYLIWYPSVHHLSLSVPKMYGILLKEGSVSSNSPKNRKKLYALLRAKRIKFKVRITASEPTTRLICRWTGGNALSWDLGRIAKWIVKKRILKEDLEQVCARFYTNGEYFPFEKIVSVFDANRSFNDIYQTFTIHWGEQLEWIKWTPFDHLHLRTSVATITLISNAENGSKDSLNAKFRVISENV